MSNLQLWLAVAGGLVLVVVVAHSTWTSRQSQPKQAEPLVSQEELDALVAEPSAELGDDLQTGHAFPGMPHELPHLDARSQLDALIL